MKRDQGEKRFIILLLEHMYGTNTSISFRYSFNYQLFMVKTSLHIEANNLNLFYS